MQPMSAERTAMRTVPPLIATMVVIASLGCQSEAQQSTPDSGATFAASTDTTRIIPCGRAQATKCKGELPNDWQTSIGGNEWSVRIDRWQHELGFGRPQMRRSKDITPARFGAFTTIYPLDDSHTIRPDKIGVPTAFAILYPAGPDVEHKWGLLASDYSRYVAILDPSNDPDKSTWHLERVYWDGDEWQRSSVPGTGKWRTCPDYHPPKDYAYADFLACGQQPHLPPAFRSSAVDVSGAQTRSALTELPITINSLKRYGVEPIWIFCPAGCCEADW